MRCDADDLYPAQRIERQVDWLDAHPEYGAICGGFGAMDESGRCELTFATPGRPGDITAELRAGTTRTHFCTFAVRAGILRAVGGMRSYFVTGEDVDMQLRLGEACRVWYSPEVTYHYRIHSTSITHQRHVRENLYFEHLAREFQAQRKLRGDDDLGLGKAPPIPDFGAADRQSATAHMQDLLIASTWAAVDDADYTRAIRYAFQGAVTRSTSLKGWRNVLVLLMKLSIGRRRRKSGKPSTDRQCQGASSASRSERTQ
jgi:hypothetical protein